MYGYEEYKNNNNDNFAFGLNQKVKITKLGIDTTKNGDIYLILRIDKGDKHIENRKFDIKKVYVGGNEITDPTHSEMIKKKKEFSSWFIHLLNAMQDKEVVKNVMNKNFTSFADFIKTGLTLVPEDLNEMNFDVFLQYQWNIKEGNFIKFFILPTNMKQGAWITQSIEPIGEWTPIINKKGLRYIDNENRVHPFMRSDWFMNSKFAQQETIKNDEETNEWASPSESKPLSVEKDDDEPF